MQKRKVQQTKPPRMSNYVYVKSSRPATLEPTPTLQSRLNEIPWPSLQCSCVLLRTGEHKLYVCTTIEQTVGSKKIALTLYPPVFACTRTAQELFSCEKVAVRSTVAVELVEVAGRKLSRSRAVNVAELSSELPYQAVQLLEMARHLRRVREQAS